MSIVCMQIIAIMACVCLKFQQSIDETSKTIQCAWQCSILQKHFPMEETRVACTSATYLKEIDDMSPYLQQVLDKKEDLTPNQRREIIDDHLRPIWGITTVWKDNFCPQCANNYSLLFYFDACMRAFRMLFERQLPQREQDKEIRKGVSMFLEELRTFKERFNCVDIIVIQ